MVREKSRGKWTPEKYFFMNHFTQLFDLLLRVKKTLPVQNMHLGETKMHVLNGPIFGLPLKIFFVL
jgi:hypothetical protein